jgi:type IV secretion system protein TrbJ
LFLHTAITGLLPISEKAQEAFMKLLSTLKTHRKPAVLGGLLLVATPAFAFLGFDIVYDPTEVAQTINNLKQAIQIALNTKQTLATMEANLKSFSVKHIWQTAKAGILTDAVHNTYGETSGWNSALNTNFPAAATAAWNMANLQLAAGTYMAGQTPGTSPDLTSLAIVEAFDSSSPNCMNAIGQYRTLQSTNAGPEEALEADQLDGSAATNSEIEQLNLLNASDAQRMHEMQAQGQLQACLVEQTTIANMAQRNAAVLAINDSAIAEQEKAANNTNFANESTTWQTYLP